MSAGELLRATIFHTPANPFSRRGDALQRSSVIRRRPARPTTDASLTCGDYHSGAETRSTGRDDGRLARRVPAAGIHRHARPFSAAADHRRTGAIAARLARARRAARGSAHGRHRAMRTRRRARFVHALASHGTTTALVFGAHFAAGDRGALRTAAASGPADRQRAGAVGSIAAARAASTPERRPSRQHRDLIERFHQRGPPALCGHAPIRALDIGSDARSVPDAVPRAFGLAASRPTSMRTARGRGSAAACFRGPPTIWRSMNATG